MEPQKYWEHEQSLRMKMGPEALPPVVRSKMGILGQKLMNTLWDLMPESPPYAPFPRFLAKRIYGRRE